MAPHPIENASQNAMHRLESDMPAVTTILTHGLGRRYVDLALALLNLHRVDMRDLNTPGELRFFCVLNPTDSSAVLEAALQRNQHDVVYLFWPRGRRASPDTNAPTHWLVVEIVRSSSRVRVFDPTNVLNGSGSTLQSIRQALSSLPSLAPYASASAEWVSCIFSPSDAYSAFGCLSWAFILSRGRRPRVVSGQGPAGVSWACPDGVGSLGEYNDRDRTELSSRGQTHWIVHWLTSLNQILEDDAAILHILGR